MDFCGLNKTTLLDYPGHVAATLFTGGCNFRCPYCHNKDLVLQTAAIQWPEAEVLAFLKKRQGILQGVCITGGEPTLQKDLYEFIVKVKALGYLVKLDTNGSNPDVLESLLKENLLDYVAMDVKASEENYPTAAGVSMLDLERVKRSMELLKQWDGEYEFRTTVVKGIHTPEEFTDIAGWIRGCKAYYLQSYRENENVLCEGYDAFSEEVLKELEERLRKMGIPAHLRGL